ncbi:hypothetical protein N7492_006911 [Penicillium capsulatum]|uniref:DUF4246 domain-containing protein n=1 Tax=Penicillium capsulatum TaxID=69766 RepID=A0A9W9HYU2_9EURO|nr:hypothetical protein N7492_006911 [Penicillium capsulatum]KAJ6116744.1 hypothetical protein N7512_006469 [Penicillium capsulatum]
MATRDFSKWSGHIGLDDGIHLSRVAVEAEIFQIEQIVTVFDLDVVKSDTVISCDLRQLMKEAVAPLGNVPEEKKDYHPGAPITLPVVYGRTSILPDQTIGLNDCLGTVGEEEMLPLVIFKEPTPRRSQWPPAYSQKFQWLPCDVQFETDGSTPVCRITSYISNAHPVKYRALYETVEKIIARAIPLWNRSLAECISNQVRVKYGSVEYDDTANPPPQWDPKMSRDNNEYRNDFVAQYGAWEDSRTLALPEPDKFTVPEQYPVDFRTQFGRHGPDYEGGSRHLEGQLNEHICASAIYYFYSENITESTLAFRQRAYPEGVNSVDYMQHRHEFLQDIFGFGSYVNGYHLTQVTQDLGSVVCREGRLITFPNVLQHRIPPFSLEDRTKHGHHKILGFFLVDPHVRIISAANVPPQREDWGIEKEELVARMLSERLPQEICDMVAHARNLNPPMSMDEAMELRRELMKEQSVQLERQTEEFTTGFFPLCEH